MLFGQATIKNCNTIMKVMHEFCDISGLRVNSHKSKLYVSPNVERRYAKELSTKCGIPLTSELGKYPGVPLLMAELAEGISMRF